MIKYFSEKTWPVDKPIGYFYLQALAGERWVKVSEFQLQGK